MRLPVLCIKSLVHLAASASTSADVLVIVTNREGIWEVQQATQLDAGCEYCGFVSFCVYPTSATVQVHAPWPAYKGFERRAKGDRRHILGAKGVVDLIVQRGRALFHRAPRGRALFHRAPGCSQKGPTSRLWVTPGARGVWVQGSSVECGQVVEVTSSPVESEGGEDQVFVRVRYGSGLEGWTNALNLHLV